MTEAYREGRETCSGAMGWVEVDSGELGGWALGEIERDEKETN